MGRLILVILLMVVSGIIYLVKAGAGKITGKDVKFEDESRKVMEKTAKGVQWMNDQWEKAKSDASGSNQLTSGGALKDLTPVEIISKIKSEPAKYDLVTAQGTYIEIAVYKMEKRQFDDAEKLIMQLSEGEARDYMLEEIRQKRND